MTCPHSAKDYLGEGNAKVEVRFRGGGAFIASVPYLSADISYRADTFGEATITVLLSDCCDGEVLPNIIDPLAHELHVTRVDDTGEQEPWVGVIVRTELTANTFTITARTLDWWMRRVVIEGAYQGWPESVFEETIAKLNSQLGLNMSLDIVRRDDDDVTGESEGKRSQAFDIIDRLLDTGIHYTMLGRTMIVGELLHRNDDDLVVATLGFGDFRNPDVFTIIKSGLGYSSRVTMLLEDDENYITVTNPSVEDYYGIAENIYTSTALQRSGITVESQAREKLGSQSSIRVTVPDVNVELKPGALIRWGELVPTLPVRIKDAVSCVDVDDVLSIGVVNVVWDRDGEHVRLTLDPLIESDAA